MAKQVKIDIVARDKTKRAIESSKKGLGGLKTFALAASAALATIGAGRAITGLVNVGKEMESLQIRFKLLFGSAEEGAKAFDTLSDFAAKVPFSLGDIAAASGNLAVVAKDAKELNKILEITGNVAGATGLDFQTTASQIQRAFSGGIASADIFREKGVRDMLDFSAGVKISVEETREAFARVFSGNGEFAKTTEELANTLEGTLSMIGDKFLAFQLAINKAFFAEIKKQFGDLNTFLDDNEENILKFGEKIGEGLAGSLTLAVERIELIKSAFDLFDRTIETATGSSETFLSVAGKLNPFFANMAKAIGFGNEKLKELPAILDAINPSMDNFVDNVNDLKTVMPEVSANTENVTTATNEMTAAMSAFDEQLKSQDGILFGLNQRYLEMIQSLGLLNDAQIKVGNSFEAQKQASREAHATEVQTAEQAADKNLEAFKKGEFGKINMKKLTDKQLGQMGRAALQEGAKINKEMFRLNQALMIGEAIMNTAAGVTKALSQGGMFAIPAAIAIGAMGAIQVATIASQQPPAMFGGARQQNTPFLVGERGAELFTPATAGTITPNHQLGGGGATVNFNITTVDAQSFGALLDTRRGQIVNMINSALNNKGQAALV